MSKVLLPARRHIGRRRALVDDVGLAGAGEHVVGDCDGPGRHVAAGANAEPDRVVGEGVAVQIQPEKRARCVGADAGTPGGDRGIGVDDVREGVARHVDVGVVREQEAVIREPIDRCCSRWCRWTLLRLTLPPWLFDKIRVSQLPTSSTTTRAFGLGS